MVRRIKAKAVLRLDGQGLSGRAMARSPGIAGQSVSGTPGAAKTAGVGWDDVADRPDAGCTRSCSRAGASVRACTGGPVGPGCAGS